MYFSMVNLVNPLPPPLEPASRLEIKIDKQTDIVSQYSTNP